MIIIQLQKKEERERKRERKKERKKERERERKKEKKEKKEKFVIIHVGKQNGCIYLYDGFPVLYT